MRWSVSATRAFFCAKGFRALMWTAGLLVVSLVPVRAQARDNVSELMHQAIAAQQNGETANAIQLYQRVLELRPRWGPAEYNLGLVISVEKRYSEAIELFNRALKDDSSLTGSYLFRGIAYYNVGDFHRALSSLRSFADAQPADPNVHYYLAGSYSALGDYPEAAREYLKQVRITPRRGDLYYYLGHCYLAMARQNLRTLSSAPAGEYYKALILGDQEAQVGKLPIADQDIQRAIQMDPQRTEAYVELGNLYLRKGQFAGAQSQFQKALKANSNDCSALEGLGDAELAAGNVQDSLSSYTRAERLLPACIQQPPPESLGLAPEEFREKLASLKRQTAPVGHESGIALELSRLEYGTRNGGLGLVSQTGPGRDSRASHAAAGSRECEAAALAGGLHSQVRRKLFRASCNELHGDVEGATLALIAAQRGAPADLTVSYWAFRILMRLSRTVLDNLAALSPNSYWIDEMRAEWFEVRGMDAAADAAYKLAAQSSGDDPDVLVEYARFQCKRFQFDEARPILLKALERVPYNASANSLLGYVYFAKNQFKEAIPCLSKAIKVNPGDEQSRIYFGESLMQLGKPQEAVAILANAPSDDDGRIHFVLSRCYRELGRKEDMKQALAIFSERQKTFKGRNRPGY